jgi:hypothetical protein
MLYYNFVQAPDNGSNNNRSIHNKSDNFYKDEQQSLCITEENRFQNEINPIKLADLGWGDDYKLDKLLR